MICSSTYHYRQLGCRIKDLVICYSIPLQLTLAIEHLLPQTPIRHPGGLEYLNCSDGKKLAFVVQLLVFDLDSLFKVIVHDYKAPRRTQLLYSRLLHLCQLCKGIQYSTISHSYPGVIQILNDSAFGAVCVEL